MRKAHSATPKAGVATMKRLEQETRKLQNLISALEGGSSSPSAIVNAIADREKVIGGLEAQLRTSVEPVPPGKLDGRCQTGLLKDDVPRVKSESRCLNLALTFTPIEAKPRPHYVVKGQCDLSALVFSLVRPPDRSGTPRRSGASLDLSGSDRLCETEHPDHRPGECVIHRRQGHRGSFSRIKSQEVKAKLRVTVIGGIDRVTPGDRCLVRPSGPLLVSQVNGVADPLFLVAVAVVPQAGREIAESIHGHRRDGSDRQQSLRHRGTTAVPRSQYTTVKLFSSAALQ